VCGLLALAKTLEEREAIRVVVWYGGDDLLQRNLQVVTEKKESKVQSGGGVSIDALNAKRRTYAGTASSAAYVLSSSSSVANGS
jgi:hypothetical protein